MAIVRCLCKSWGILCSRHSYSGHFGLCTPFWWKGTLAWNSLWAFRTSNSTVHNNVVYGLGKAGKRGKRKSICISIAHCYW